MQKREPRVWQVRKGMDRRVRGGHPWVYSNELTSSPQGILPGEPIELRDVAGQFLAWGYGNPHSLIAFRSVSRNPGEQDATAFSGVFRKLLQACRLRDRAGWGGVSHRLCFGEADGLPGWVIDRYRHATQHPQGDAQTFVVQAHTAGAQAWSEDCERLLKSLQEAGAFPGVTWDQTSIILRNDVAVRKLEGIEVEPPRILKQAPGVNLQEVAIRVRSADSLRVAPLEFWVDLVGGQKTGFFLDQSANIEMALWRWLGRSHLNARLDPSGQPEPAALQSFGSAHPAGGVAARPIRILDLCCYVGQWSTQLVSALKQRGYGAIEVLAVDASAKALELASRNIRAQGAQVETLKADVLQGLADLPDQGFDFVIADPPALIKSRKDLPAGTRAYQKLLAQAFRLTAAEGHLVCCSCSGLLDAEAFAQVLSQAGRISRRVPRWLGQGSHASDHPILTAFPEGRYLKAWIGVFEAAPQPQGGTDV